MTPELKQHIENVIKTLKEGACVDYFALDADHEIVHPSSDSAIKFCLRGASYKCAGLPESVPLSEISFNGKHATETNPNVLPMHWEFMQWMHSKVDCDCVATWFNDDPDTAISSMEKFLADDQ